jgi:D-3-phosphoglycerate dehydrogenase / 2-oxoglutarate reductase
LPKVLIKTVPFGEKDRLPLDLLENAGIEYLKNPFNKKITEDQLTKIIFDFDAIIAGTEPITEQVLDRASKLKLMRSWGIQEESVKNLRNTPYTLKLMICKSLKICS